MASKKKDIVRVTPHPPHHQTSFHKTIIPNPNMNTDICKTISQYKTKLGSDLLPPSVLPKFLFKLDKLDKIKPAILNTATKTRKKNYTSSSRSHSFS